MKYKTQRRLERFGTYSIALGIVAAILFAVDLWVAQLVVWGLSLFHVDSGIWGPYFLLTALSSVISVSITTAVRKD